MQVFIIGSPLETAQALDSRRLHKQVIEGRQILRVIAGNSDAWAHHPATLQYYGRFTWLLHYVLCLHNYRKGRIETAQRWSEMADKRRPDFHTQEYFDQMKRRLYTKDPQHYAQWEHLGTSDVNWYFINGAWKYYKNGKTTKK